MRILIDENLPPRLSERLADLFPEMHHVSALALQGKPDSELWRFAHTSEYAAIFTTDVDFQNKSWSSKRPQKWYA